MVVQNANTGIYYKHSVPVQTAKTGRTNSYWPVLQTLVQALASGTISWGKPHITKTGGSTL